MFVLKFARIANAIGVALFGKLLGLLHVGKGDALCEMESPSAIYLTLCDPALEEQLVEGREFMREYRDAFCALAK